MRYVAIVIYWVGNVIGFAGALLVLGVIGWLGHLAVLALANNDHRELRELLVAGLLAIGITWLLTGLMKLHDWAGRNRKKPLTMKDLV